MLSLSLGDHRRTEAVKWVKVKRIKTAVCSPIVRFSAACTYEFLFILRDSPVGTHEILAGEKAK